MKRVILEVHCIVPDFCGSSQIEGILEDYEFTVQEIFRLDTRVVNETDGYVSMALWRSEEEIKDPTKERLDYLLSQIEAECISMSELHELQALGEDGLIPEDQLTLREWAGLPEFPDEEEDPIGHE